MKIEIEINDFYLEDEDLESGLKDHVHSKVIQEIWKRIEKKVESHLQLKIAEEIEKNMYKQMNFFIAEHINTGQVKSSKDSNKMVSIADFISEKFQNDSGWGYNNVFDKIKAHATTLATEMKNRYDMLFASQLVAKMNDIGLLKDDVAKYLIEDPKQQK